MSGKKSVTEWTQQDVEAVLKGIDLKEEAKQTEQRRLDSLARTAAQETAVVGELAKYAELLEAQAEVASITSGLGRRRRRRRQPPYSESKLPTTAPPNDCNPAASAAANLSKLASDVASSLRQRDRLLGPDAKNEDPARLAKGNVPLQASRRVAKSTRKLLSRLEYYYSSFAAHGSVPSKTQADETEQPSGKPGPSDAASVASSLQLLGSSAERKQLESKNSHGGKQAGAYGPDAAAAVAHRRSGPCASTAGPQSAGAALPVAAAEAVERVGDVLRRCARQATRCAAERSLALGCYRRGCDHFRTLLAQAHSSHDQSVWVRRGLCCLGMGALCLAEMHADRAVELAGERPEHVAVEAPALEGRVVRPAPAGAPHDGGTDGGTRAGNKLDVIRWEVAPEGSGGPVATSGDGGDEGAYWKVVKGSWEPLDPGAGEDLVKVAGLGTSESRPGDSPSREWWSDPESFKRGLVRVIDSTAGWSGPEWMAWQRARWGSVLAAEEAASADDGVTSGDVTNDGVASRSAESSVSRSDLVKVATLLRYEGNVLFEEGFFFTAGVKFRSAAAAILLGVAGAEEATLAGDDDEAASCSASAGVPSWVRAVVRDASLLADLGIDPGNLQVEARGKPVAYPGALEPAGASHGSEAVAATTTTTTNTTTTRIRIQFAMCMLNSAACFVKMEDPRQAARGERAAAAALRALQGLLGRRGDAAVEGCLEAAKEEGEPGVTSDDGGVTGASAGSPAALELAVRASIRLARSRGMRGLYSLGHRTAKAAAALVAAAAEASVTSDGAGSGGGEGSGWDADRSRRWAREAYAEGRRWAFAGRDAGGDVVQA